MIYINRFEMNYITRILRCMSILNINAFRGKSSSSNLSWIEISNERYWYEKYLRILRDYMNYSQYLKEDMRDRILYISKALYTSRLWNTSLEERKWEWYMRLRVRNASLERKMRERDWNWSWEEKIELQVEVQNFSLRREWSHGLNCSDYDVIKLLRLVISSLILAKRFY